jgi:hypothetical protein
LLTVESVESLIFTKRQNLFAEMGIHYFFLYSLFAILLLQFLFSLLLLLYFSENCNTLLAIHYRYFSLISVADWTLLWLHLLKKEPETDLEPDAETDLGQD